MDQDYKEVEIEDFVPENEEQNNDSGKGKGGRNRFGTIFVINILLYIVFVSTPLIDYFDIVIKSQRTLNLPFGLGVYTITSIVSGVVMGILLSWALSSSFKKYIENILLFAGFTSGSFWACFGYCTLRGDVWSIDVLVFMVISTIFLFLILLVKSLLRKISKKLNSGKELA